MTAPATAPARPRLMTGPFLALSLASLVYFVADGMVLPVLPIYVAGPLGGNDVSLGLVFGAFSITALLVRPFVGSYADRRGRRPVLIGGAALLIVTMLGHLVATSVPLLIVMRLLLGASEAAFFVAALTMSSDLADENRRGEALSLISLSLYAGVAIGPFIGEAVLGEDRFWAVWIAAAALAAVAVLLTLRVPETRPEPEMVEGVAVPRRYRLFHPGGIVPGLIILAGTWGMAGFFAFAQPYGEELGMPGVATLYLLFAGIVIAIRALAPWAPDRYGGRRLGAVALASVVVGVAVMGLLVSPPGFYIGTAIMALGVAFVPPAIFTMAQVGVPALERGTLIGTTSLFIEIGFGVAPVALGVVAAGSGYPATFLISAAVGVVGLLLLAAYRPRSARAEVEADEAPEATVARA